MSGQNKIVTVFGGTGFIGEHLISKLAANGFIVKVATRAPESAYFLKTCGAVGQVVPFTYDYNNPDSINEAIHGSDYVVNCIGVLFEKRKNSFQKAHIDIPQAIAKACKKHNVKRFVHISALSCDKGTSKYAKTKFAGEKEIKKAFKNVTILRPSVIFGTNDNFFNMFAELSRYTPILPLIGGGKTKFQPVYVGDVVSAIIAALSLPAIGDKNPCGKIYELGGPEVTSFRGLYEQIFNYTNRRRVLVSLPWGLAKIQASFMQLLPKPLLTRDQVETLKCDNIVSKKALMLSDLDIAPTPMASILPGYLSRYKSGGAFNNKKRA